MYGQILRIDLTKEKVRTEAIPAEWKEKYLGAEGINDRIFWEHFLRVDPKINPLSPNNILIGGVGPLGGTGALGAGTKMKWTFKSPAYNIFGDSVGSGFFGSQLRMAGFDYLVITGKAKRPIYLWIDDDQVEIRSAEKIWGTDAHQADTLIKEDIGCSEAETALIGQAGENLVRFGCIVLSRNRTAARTGGGCVMGSKNLKGIAVRGTKGIKIASPKRFFRITEKAYQKMEPSPTWQVFAKEGTTFLVEHYNLAGGQPWQNHQSSAIPEDIARNLESEFYLEKFKFRDAACAAGCATACSHWWKIDGDETPFAAQVAGQVGEKPDYGFIASCLCWGVKDMAEVLHAQTLWDKYGMDSFEIGESIGFLMEMFQRGVINKQDLKKWTGEPMDLNWGDVGAVERITEAVALKKNKLYDIVKGGVYQTARMIEKLKRKPVMKYCQYGGKHSAEAEDIRNRPTWALLMAVSTRGADHLKALTTMEQMHLVEVSKKVFGTTEGTNPENPYLVGVVLGWEENRTTAMNCTGLCIFNSATWTYTGPGLELVTGALKAVNGQAPADLLSVGERAYNLEKAFNARLGLTRQDDTLCHAWMNDPVPKGFPGEGKKVADHFDQWLDEYYDYRGWDKETGLQTIHCLERLGLEDVAKVLKKEGAVSTAKPPSRSTVLKKTVRKAEQWKTKHSQA